MDGINLAKPMNSGDWKQWSTDASLSPVFGRTDAGSEACLVISMDKTTAYGKWTHKIIDIKDECSYDFSVEYFPENVVYENKCVIAMLTWTDSNGKLLTRDYADYSGLLSDGWRQLTYHWEAPAGAACVEIELVFRWAECGRLTWRRARLAAAEKRKRKPVRVATTLLRDLPGNREKNLERVLNCIDGAGADRPDIICLSEGMYTWGIEAPYHETGDELPNKFTLALSEKAEQYGCYIIAALLEKENGHLYNTAILIDRDGKIAGKYQKTHLPLCEAEMGIIPGNEYPVFDTDFGRIGILICWDHWFPESARILRLKGAEIIFIPTLGNAYIQSLARAVDNGIYVVVAGMGDDRRSRIIDPLGKIIAEIDNDRQQSATAEIQLSAHHYQHWLSVGNADGDVRNIFVKEWRPDSYKLISEDL